LGFSRCKDSLDLIVQVTRLVFSHSILTRSHPSFYTMNIASSITTAIASRFFVEILAVAFVS